MEPRNTRRHLTHSEIDEAIGMLRSERSQTDVARYFNVNCSVICRLWRRQCETGSPYVQRPGRVRLTTPSQDHYIRLQTCREPTLTARQLQSSLYTAENIFVSDQTIRNRLHEHSIHARRPLRCPPLQTSVTKRSEFNPKKNMVERIEDLNLPSAVVARLIKDAIPPNASVSKEARAAIARAASVFVTYLTASSTTLAKKMKNKSITANNILGALEQLEFESFVEPLKEELETYRKTVKEKKDVKANNKKEEIIDVDADAADE